MFIRKCAAAGIILLLLAGLVGCELGGIDGDQANYISFVGEGPDGERLGFAGNTIPMVDSTVIIRVLVADTVLSNRAGQGLPVGAGSARVIWAVTGGVVNPEVSVVGDFGIAETQWTLGTQVDQQTIVAQLEGVPAGSVSFTLAGQSSRSGLFPGPPVEAVFGSDRLEVREGSGATLELLELRDAYGNAWNLDLYDFTLQSLDTTIVRNADPGIVVAERATVRGLRGGESELHFTATGVLTSDYDFRSLFIEANVPVNVLAFEGFAAVFERVSAGSDFACGVAGVGTPATPGAVYCWGNQEEGKLGTANTSTSLDAPRPDNAVVGLPVSGQVTALASGARHSCVVVDRTEVYCWGSNSARQLGSFGTSPGANRVLTDNPNAATVSESAFVDVVTGLAHTCVLGESGAVYCWGNNTQGQLGNGSMGASQILPQRVQGVDGIRMVSLASVGSEASHTCAISENEGLYCWGEGTSGQLGDGTLVSRGMAMPIAGGLAVRGAATAADLATGSAYSCLIATDGSVHCWGRRPERSGAIATPERLDTESGEPFEDVAAGARHLCLLGNEGEVYCLGTAESGRLGTGVDNPELGFLVPQLVGDGRMYTQVAIGERFSLALQQTGALYSWGSNAQGQLGQATDAQQVATPVRVVFASGGGG